MPRKGLAECPAVRADESRMEVTIYLVDIVAGGVITLRFDQTVFTNGRLTPKDPMTS